MIFDILAKLDEDPALVSRVVIDFKVDEPAKIFIVRYADVDKFIDIKMPNPDEYIKIVAVETKP